MLVVQSRTGNQRRGMILMVVLALLTLFTIVGITFVFMADAYALSARVAKEAQNLTVPDIEPEKAFAFVLGQILYDADDNIGVQSALRGHSLARTMYGWNSAGLNDKAYAGLGRLRYPNGTYPTVSEWDMVNYQYFAADVFVRDPERLGTRASPSAAQNNPYVVGSVPYTYPDQNNMFLAHLDPATNQVVVPSFHRNWLVPLGNPADPSWTSPEGKYKILRPRPQTNAGGEHPQFPYPADQFGDVKNYDGGAGGNDSIWLDPGGPVIVAPNGQKYKMLAAPLILALDGRVNLNVHGNVLGGAPSGQTAHAGNQGWGPWEVNLSQVMTLGGGTEWKNLFLGNPPGGAGRVVGRYGTGQYPLSKPGQQYQTGDISRAWGRTDLNGVNDPVVIFGTAANPAFSPTTQYVLSNTFNSFPTFPNQGYNDGGDRETTANGQAGGTPIYPMIFNTMRPATGNRIFSAADMAALLRYGGTNAEFLSSDLLRLCPNNFADPTNGAKIRNLVTSYSYDLDRPMPIAYVWNQTTTPYTLNTTTYPYTLQQANNQTTPYSPNTLAALSAARTATPATGSEFDPNSWRSNLLTALTKVNLNRKLTDYPSNTTGSYAANIPQFQQAQGDRQQLAADIFNVLVQVTGAYYPGPQAGPYVPSKDPNLTSAKFGGVNGAQWGALRYLAQLSVNIVDFVDYDDNITPFNWSSDPTDNYVYGVELPRLVLNEVYVQYDNDPADPGLTATPPKATTHYNVNVWVELLNPLNATSDPSYTGVNPPNTRDPEAWLTNSAGSPIYQVVIAQPKLNIPTLQYPGNTLGDPNYVPPGSPPPVPAPVLATATDFGRANANPVKVLPVNGGYSGTAATGFFSLAPQAANYPAAQNPGVPMNHRSASMTYQVPLTAANVNTVPQPTILLRRLLCPWMPNQNNPGLPNYNPYITTDYVEQSTPVAPKNDARKLDTNGPNANYQVVNLRQSMGRNQPYDARVKASLPQAPNPALATAQHTFRQQNATVAPPGPAPGAQDPGGTLKLPFDWPVLLDRQFLSKGELLYVSACKPHELTHLFVQTIGGTDIANSQGVDSTGTNVWLNQSTWLYRFLEFGDAGPRSAGTYIGCRLPGKININLVFAPEVFRAICDSEPGNSYYTAANPNSVVDSIFTQLVNARQPGGGYVGTGTPPVPKQTDAPFWGFGTGPSPGGDALSTGPRGLNGQLVSVGAATNNPYQRFEMLNKIMNNVTTRSNVFGVWVTVGFFEVTNNPSSGYLGTGTDFSQPPQLGAEIGKAENRNIRHRMFSIVDRTNLQVFSTTSSSAITGPANNTGAGVSNQFQLAQTTGTTQSGATWTVQTGSVLVFEPNTDNEETVIVQGGSAAAGFTATFFRSHPQQGATYQVISRGNPGPSTQQPYNPRADTGVVPYFAIIE